MYDTIRRAGRPVLRTPGVAALVLAAGTALAQQASSQDSHHAIEEIVVTATPLSRTVEQLAQPTSVLSGDDLTMKQSTSIGETVSGELGVSSTYFGPVSSRPVIRGQYGERVRVLSNALDALDASALSEDHQVSLEGILAERVEIVRGPATLLYGSGAAGGLVNVVDRRIIESPLAEPFSGAVSLGTGSATGEQSAAGRIAFGSDRLGVHLDYFRRETDDVEIPGFAESALLRSLEEEDGHESEEAFGLIENTDSETDGGAIGVSFTRDRGFLGVAVSAFNSEYGIPGHGHHDEEEEVVRIDLEQRRLDLRGEYSFTGPITLLKGKFASTDYQHVELEGDEVGTRFDTRGTDARIEMRHADIGALEGAFGLQFQRTDFDAVGDEAFVPGSDTRRSSLFAFEEFGLSDRWVLQMSGRIERQAIDIDEGLGPDYQDTAYGASLGAIWSMTEQLSLAVNYALTQRHPNSTELFADGPHLAVNRFERGSVVLGDGFLDKELSSNLDLTMRGRTDFMEWSVTGFINSVDDYIVLSPTGDEEDDLPVFEYGQTDVEFYGFEIETRIELFDSDQGHMHARVFSDLVFAEQKDTGAYLPRLTPWRYGLGLHYTVKRISAGIDAAFHDQQDKIAVNELPSGSYVLLTADLSWSLDQHGLFLFVRGTNLTDEDARQHSSPLKDTVPLPGRSLHLGVRYDF
jgi:iron complex outermembrane receptor protein